MFTETTVLLERQDYPRFPDSLPSSELREGRYSIRFARGRDDLDAILRLRFEVFNLELGEGLEASHQTGRDLDEYDLACHHLMVVETANDEVIGTYRLQTGAMAAAGRGFYSANEFDLAHLPVEVLEDSIELGRACIARAHRNTAALFLLWKGLATYVAHNRKRFLFGCCSLTSQDAREGRLISDLLERDGHLDPLHFVPPRHGLECYEPGFRVTRSIDVKLPKLFRAYLRFGAKVCGPPAIDREFKTIDYFVLFDVFGMDARSQRMYFGV